MADRNCEECEGCGKVADVSGEPWTAWENLPLKSAGAVIIGIVKPVPCPKCLGLGDTQAADAVRLLRDRGYTPAQVAKVMEASRG